MFRVISAPTEDPASIPSTAVPWNATFSSGFLRDQAWKVVYRQTCSQNMHTHKNKIYLIEFHAICFDINFNLIQLS